MVAAVLASPRGHSFSLAHVLPSWHRRGLALDCLPEGWKCVRADANEDKTNGFFVAKFERNKGVGRCSDEKDTAEAAVKTKKKKKKKTKKKKKSTAAA